MLRKIGKTKKWSRDGIIKEIRMLHRNGVPLNVTYFLGNYFALYTTMVKYFGSYGKAIEASGLDYCRIKRRLKRKKPLKWTPKKVLKEILKLYRAKGSIHSRFIQAHHRNLYNAAMRYFGSYKKAVEATGLDYAQISVRQWKATDWIKSLDGKKMEELRKRIKRLEGGNGNE